MKRKTSSSLPPCWRRRWRSSAYRRSRGQGGLDRRADGGRAEVLRRPLAMSDTYEIKQDDGAVNVIAVENGAVYMKGSQLPRRTLHPSGQNEKTRPKPSSACR